MTKVANRVVETTSTTGTGTLDLDGAQTGYRGFADELASGDSVYYLIEDDPDSPTDWEYGIGTFTSGSPNTLSRDTVLDSSNGGSKVSLTGSNTVTGIMPVEKLSEYETVANVASLQQIAGLVPSNGTDADHDIDISVGVAASDDDAVLIALTSALTKQIDAAWSVGTDAGGLDTGSVTTDTWYALWLIRRSDTGVVDALFSTSFSSPTMPGSYDQKRYIGAVLTDSSSNIIAFDAQEEGGGALRVEWLDPPNDVTTSSQSTTAITRTLSVPPRIVRASLHVSIGRGASSEALLYIRNPAVNDEAPSTGVAPHASIGHSSGSSGETSYGQVEVKTNASGQVTTRADAASTLVNIDTLGWLDSRR